MRFSSWTEPIPLSDVGGAWVFPEQSVLYTESTSLLPTVEHAETLFDFFDWARSHFPTARPPTLIHDWRSMQSIPADVRRAFVARRKRMGKVRPERVIIAATLSPIVRMGIRTVSLAAQVLVQAVRFELVDDPLPALAERGVVAPDASLHARLRLAWRHARSGGAGDGSG